MIQLNSVFRVMLDMLSVQGNIDNKWDKKIEKAFWRGRDSRRERLKLITIAREHPNLFNASLTNFFFYRNEEKYYGPKVPHVSFFKFFDVSICKLVLQLGADILVIILVKYSQSCCYVLFINVNWL